MDRHNQRMLISEGIDRLATLAAQDVVNRALTEVKAERPGA